MIEEAYVSFETAKLLKEKGFDEICSLGYGNNGIIHPIPQIKNSELEHFLPKYSCPTQQMAMRWLREVHNIDIVVFHEKLPHDCYWARVEQDLYTQHEQEPTYKSYEESTEEAIQYSLKNLI